MNVRKWLHKATQINLKTLQDFGYLFIGPEKGEMACGEYGEGKMSSPKQIFSFLENYFKKRNSVKERKLKAIVTAGPTREFIDPVRYISNESSGKQGYEIAVALSKMGVKTTLISGPTNIIFQKGIRTKKITTAEEMLEEVKKSLPVDIAICAAAVSDFKPISKSTSKLKKNQDNLNSIKLKKNKDIVEYLGKNNKFRPKLVVGFAAETENLNKNAFTKMKEKNCDLIIANDVSEADKGFNSDFNKVNIISNNGKIIQIKKNKKSYIAHKIVEVVLNKFFVDDRNFN